MPVSTDDLAKAYLNLLRMPLASSERLIHAQRAMSVLRDLIAERTGRSSEDVQTGFEQVAAEISEVEI